MACISLILDVQLGSQQDRRIAADASFAQLPPILRRRKGHSRDAHTAFCGKCLMASKKLDKETLAHMARL